MSDYREAAQLAERLVLALERSVGSAKQAASSPTGSAEQRRELRALVRKDIHNLANLANPGPGSESLVDQMVDQMVAHNAVAVLVPLLEATKLRAE